MDLMDAYAAQPPAERESWLTTQRTTQGTALLSDLDYLTLRLKHGGSRALLAEIPDEPRWSVLREVVALSAVALDSSPALLPSQLLGRLRDDDGYTNLLRAAAARRGLLPLTANLARPVRPLLATLRGHHDFIGGLIVLPGERIAVSASEDHTIRTWDLDHHTPLDIITAHSGPVNRLLLLPDGGHFASCSDDRTVRLWDAATLDCLAVLDGHRDFVSAMACTPDGRTLLSAGRDGAILVWDLPRRRLRCRLEGHSAWVVAIAISPDGLTAVTSSISNELWTWDLRTLRRGRPFYDAGRGGVRYVMGDVFVGDNNRSGTGHRSYARALAFLPGGQRLLTARDGLILWDVTSRRQLRRLSGHAWPIDALSIDPSGRVVTGARSLKRWDLSADTATLTLPGHDGCDIDAIVPLSGGRLLTSGHDGCIRLWDPSIQGDAAHTGRVSGVRFTPCGDRVVSAAGDGSLRVWSTDGACAHVLGGLSGIFARIGGFVPGGVVGTSSEGELRVWDLTTGALRAALRHPSSGYSIEGVATSPDGAFAVAGGVGEGLGLWDLSAGGAPLRFHGAGRFLSHVALLPDGDSVLTASSYQGDDTPGVLQRWSLSGRRLIEQRSLDGDGYTTGLLCSDDEALVADSRGTLYRVALGPLRVIERARAGGGRQWVQLLPCGDDLVTLHRGMLRRWNRRDLSDPVELGRLDPRASLAARDGDRLVYAVDEDVFLWSISGQRSLGRFRADSRISALAIRDDRIAVGEHSGRVHLVCWVS